MAQSFCTTRELGEGEEEGNAKVLSLGPGLGGVINPLLLVGEYLVALLPQLQKCLSLCDGGNSISGNPLRPYIIGRKPQDKSSTRPKSSELLEGEKCMGWSHTHQRTDICSSFPEPKAYEESNKIKEAERDKSRVDNNVPKTTNSKSKVLLSAASSSLTKQRQSSSFPS